MEKQKQSFKECLPNIKSTALGNAGVTLVEMTMAFIVFALVVVFFFTFMVTYMESYSKDSSQLDLEQSARSALEVMNRELRDAEQSSISVVGGSCYRIVFTKKTDGLTYNYYVDSGKKQLLKGLGILCAAGKFIVGNVDAVNTSIVFSNNLVTIQLALQKGDSRVTLLSRVKPRN